MGEPDMGLEGQDVAKIHRVTLALGPRSPIGYPSLEVLRDASPVSLPIESPLLNDP